MGKQALIIGLTGGIGSGKSAAMKIFTELNVPCIDADHVAKAIVEPGQPALQAIIGRYGEGLLLPAGELDRKQLRQIVFAKETEKQWLEHLLHPLINTKIQHWLNNRFEPYAILCSPLLLETSQKNLVDRILLIDAPEDIQVARTIARDGNSSLQVKKIINSQLPRTLKQQNADDIILNDKDLGNLRTQVLEMNKKYLQLAELNGNGDSG